MNENQRKIIRQKLVRQSAPEGTPFENRWGMTPAQIHNATKTTTTPHMVVSNGKRLEKIRQRDKRPLKVERPKPVHQRLQFLLDSDFIQPTCYDQYACPDWFISKGKAEVSVIVPMFRSAVVIRNLIQSWDVNNGGIKVEIIFVDDNCPGDSKNAVLASWIARRSDLKGPVGKLLYSTQSQGFGSACNAGAAVATGDILIFLNADTMVTEGWIGPMMRLLQKPDVGIVGNLQLKQGTELIDSAGSEWLWDNKTFLHIGRDSYDGKAIKEAMSIRNCPANLFNVEEREMVTGCCIAIKNDLFKSIGGFNPNYRIGYWEDTELCMVVKEKGYKVMYQPNSRIYHKGSHSGSGNHRYNQYNCDYFFNKWVGSGRIDKIVKTPRPNKLPEIANILLKRDAAHGDVLIAAAVAPALKKMYPKAKITFNTICPEVLLGNPYINNTVHEINDQNASFQIYYNLDMAYELRPNTNILEAYANAVGVRVEDCEIFLKTENWTEQLPPRYIVIHAGRTNWAGRDWSATKFELVANRLRKEGKAIVCVGTLQDHKVPCDKDLRGRTSIQQLASIIKNSELFVGIDSFPMHVAQTFDIPGVAFFGSVDPRTRILNDNMLGITAESLNCLGCHHRKPPPSVSTTICETQLMECVNLVSVEQMMKAITKQWGTKDG